MGWNLLLKQFLRMSSLLSKIWSKNSGAKNAVERHERVTRFIVKSDYFTGERVKWNAFSPYKNPASHRLETSIYRELRLTAAEIWRLGRKHVENLEQNREIKARGSGPVSPILERGLALDVNGPPEPIHADIVGWPAEKHEQRQLAMEFVSHFKAEPAPSR